MKWLYCLTIVLVGATANADDPLLKPNDRLALLGGTFVERMQSSGALEAQLQTRRPDWKLSVRNLGWSGDDVHGTGRKVFGDAAQGLQRLLRDVATADPTVILVAYGFSEAGDGIKAVERFESGLQELVSKLQEQQRSVVLVTPVAMPGYRVAGYRELIDRCRDIVNRVGVATDVPVISVDWAPAKDELAGNKLLPSDQGYAALATQIAGDLVGGAPSDSFSDDIYRLISEKNQLFFHRYRPQNETYLFLFRKHEQGNNAVEIPRFDPLIRAADEAIWKTAGQP